MADYDMNALLKSYGAPMSARNANLAREFFASNPEVAAHRAMGMRGSVLDDNSDLLNAMLDKVVADTAATPPTPQGQIQVGQPVIDTVKNATGQTRRNATAAPDPYAGFERGSGRQGRDVPPHRQPVGMPADRGTTQGYEPSTGAPMPVPSGMDVNAGSGSGILPIILAALGVGGGAYATARAIGNRATGTSSNATVKGDDLSLDSLNPRVGASKTTPSNQISGGPDNPHMPTPDEQALPGYREYVDRNNPPPPQKPTNRPYMPQTERGSSVDPAALPPKNLANPADVRASVHRENYGIEGEAAAMAAEQQATEARLLEQVMRRNADQNAARDLLKKSGRFLGRRP